MKSWKIIGIIIACIVILCLAALMIVGLITPETSVYREKDIPKRYLAEIKKLGLIEDSETIRFFYSDAIFDIKEGMYFTTDRKLTIYTKEWDEPIHQLELADINSIDAQYNDSFIEDSWIIIITRFGDGAEFPLSSEKKRDRLFIQHIEDHAPLARELREDMKKLSESGDGEEAHTRPRLKAVQKSKAPDSR